MNTAFYNNSENWDNGILYCGKALIKADENITEVSIRPGTKVIADSAFYNCASLTSIVIPDSVTSIGAEAFLDCTSLTSITMSDAIESVGTYAFYRTAFYDDPENLDNGILYCGKALIKADENITEVSIRPGTKVIAGYVFSNCTSLTSVIIPNSVTFIGCSAFDGCTGLTSIDIPDSVKYIDYGTFTGCGSLSEITVSENNKYYDSRNNCNAIIRKSDNSLVVGCKNTVIPDSVTSIGNYAFSGCTGLTSIIIPDSVTSIGDDTFYGCTGLTSITIPDSVTSIGNEIFSGCTGLTSIVIPDSVTSIGRSAFYGCNNLKTVSIGKGLTVISEHCFGNCSSIEEIVIPHGIMGGEIIIEKDAFKGTNLKKIVIPQTVTKINSEAFPYSEDTTIYGCKGSYAETFANDNNFKFVDITKNISSIRLADGEYYNDQNQKIAESFSNSEKLILVRGETAVPLFDYQPAEATDIITLSTSDANVASIIDNAICGNAPGTATVTATTSGGLTYDFTVEVIKVLSSITVTKLPDKTDYVIGEDFDSTGIVVLANYSDGSSETVANGLSYSGFDSETVGTKTITVTYEGKTATFTVEVVKVLTSITVTKLPDKTDYVIGEDFDSTGIVVTANYSDGSRETVTNGLSYSGFDSETAGTKTITVTYEGKTTTFTVGVVKVLTSITVAKLPDKTTYVIGEDFDSTGIVVLAKYSDGSRETVTNGLSYSGFDSETAGTKTITVTYEGKSKTFTVQVKALTSITVTKLPDKTAYVIGEDFDSTGIVVMLNYSDGSSKTVTSGLSYSGFDSETVGTKTITVTYEGKSTTFTVEVGDVPAGLLSITVTKLPDKTDYVIGEKFESTGIVVLANYSDGSSETVANGLSYSGFDSETAGTKTITVTYEGKSTTFTVEVGEPISNYDNIVIKTAGAQTVDYRNKVIVTATAEGVPEDCKLALFINGNKVVTGSNESVTYSAGELKSDLSYTVKVVDQNGNAVIDGNGNEISKEGGKITCNASFIKKLIAFFKGLFGLLSDIEIKP